MFIVTLQTLGRVRLNNNAYKIKNTIESMIILLLNGLESIIGKGEKYFTGLRLKRS